MRQIERDYADALDGLRFSDEAKERMLKTMTEGRSRAAVKGKRFRPLRVVLAAAALCAAMVGTAMAANPEAAAQLFQRLTVQSFSKEEGEGYHVEGGAMTKYPLSAFSPELRAASEGRESVVVTLSFDTWDQVRAFLGEEIPILWPDGGREWDQGQRFWVYLFHTETEQLWGVDVESTSIDRQLGVCAQIRTELWRGTNASGGRGIGEGRVEHLGSYAMANGATAEMVNELGTEEHPNASANGYFMRDGILYETCAFGNLSTQEEMTARLKAVLDSFQ